MTGLPSSAFYDQTLPDDVAVSPDGTRIAYVATEYNGTAEAATSSLFVVPADGSRPPHRLTRASSASAPTWSPDGSRLGFVASREADTGLTADRAGDRDANDAVAGHDVADRDRDATTVEGGERGPNADAGDEEGGADEVSDDENDTDGLAADEPQVWAFDVERGGDARQLTTREEGVEDFDWGPDGERIVVQARDPTPAQRERIAARNAGAPIVTERLQHKLEGRGYLDDVTRYLFVVDVESRTERRLDAATIAGLETEFPEWSSLAWGEGGIAFGTHVGGQPDESYTVAVQIADPETGDVRTATDGEWMDRVVGWSPDGETLAILRQRGANWHVPTDLCLVDPDAVGADVEADPPTPTRCSDGLDRTVMDAAWLDDDRLVARVGDEGRTRLYAFESGGDPAPIDGVGVLGCWDVDAAAGTVGVVGTRPNRQDVYALTVAGDDPRVASGPSRRTACNDDLVERAPLECAQIAFENADCVEVEGLVYASEGTGLDEWLATGDDPSRDGPDGPLPLLVDVHGGPRYHNEPCFWFEDRYFASRGYLVCKVNYRGSTSYGREFSESIRGEWGPRETDDVVRAIDHLVDRGLADPDRVFVSGFSSGARITAYVLSRTDVATAGAVRHGTYDPRSAFGSDDSQAWWGNDFGVPWENPEGYDAASSITDVDDIDDPLLVTAGEDDLRCTLHQAEQLYVSVRKRGVPSKLVVYPGTGHTYWDAAYAPHRVETLLAWFREHDPAVDADEEAGSIAE